MGVLNITGCTDKVEHIPLDAWEQNLKNSLKASLHEGFHEGGGLQGSHPASGLDLAGIKSMPADVSAGRRSRGEVDRAVASTSADVARGGAALS